VGSLTATTSQESQATISAAQMQRYTDLIYKTAGIRIPLQKTALLTNRIRRRLKETGCQNFDVYYSKLSKLKASDPEWDCFLQEITTHETYLFRDEAQWKWFREDYLSEIAAESRRGERTRTLRIWSAACSTGDEAYTAACCVAAGLPNHSLWNIQIVGTDIGVGALEQAKNAEFGERAMRLVPAAFRNSYFTKNAEAPLWKAKPILSEMVTFKQHNLLDPLREAPFDLVFLKNVLIYFDKDSKSVVVDHLTKLIRSNGLLLAGAAEGISDLLGNLQRIESWLYRRPADKKGAS
jgi:chemotaxis protein methyltransferase CheR